MKPAKSNIYARPRAGLFFCLASAEDAGLLFLPGCNTSPYKRLQRVLCCSCNLYRTRYKTAHKALQGIFLQLCPLNSPRHQTDTSGYNTACATLERITASQHLQYIPDTRRHAGRYTGQHSRPIIIRYIRAQRCAPVIDPCQTVQHIADHASPAGSRCFQRLALAWHRVGLALAWHCAFFLARRRGTIDGYRRISFRAFARYPIRASNSRGVPAEIVVTASGIVVADSRNFSDKIVVE